MLLATLLLGRAELCAGFLSQDDGGCMVSTAKNPCLSTHGKAHGLGGGVPLCLALTSPFAVEVLLLLKRLTMVEVRSQVICLSRPKSEEVVFSTASYPVRFREKLILISAAEKWRQRTYHDAGCE